jgi:hypothetical protein
MPQARRIVFSRGHWPQPAIEWRVKVNSCPYTAQCVPGQEAFDVTVVTRELPEFYFFSKLGFQKTAPSHADVAS